MAPTQPLVDSLLQWQVVSWVAWPVWQAWEWLVWEVPEQEVFLAQAIFLEPAPKVLAKEMVATAREWAMEVAVELLPMLLEALVWLNSKCLFSKCSNNKLPLLVALDLCGSSMETCPVPLKV